MSSALTFANSIDPNQDRCPDLVSHRLTDTLIVFLKDLFEEKRELILKKKLADDNRCLKSYPPRKELINVPVWGITWFCVGK